jgi:hypothetical protein
MLSNFISSVILLSTASLAQDMPLCDKYTTALFKENTEANQLALLTALVNTVVIGNYSATVTGTAVPGILAPADYMGQKINFLGNFDGSLATSNVNNVPSKVNFLDGGGAAPLLKSKSSNDPASKQDFLLNHLYQVFGALLGCSKQGGSTFPAYSGDKSLYETHKFMGLGEKQIDYFIAQVGAAALGFGVSVEDATAVGGVLKKTFNVQCSAPIKLGGLDGSQGMCVAKDCPSAEPRVCPDGFDQLQSISGSTNTATGTPMVNGSSSAQGAYGFGLALLSMLLI